MTSTPPPSVNWRAVVTFYVLACGISWPFFWWRDMHGDTFWRLPLPWFAKAFLYMGGPAIAAIIVMFVLRMRPHRRRITLLGHAPGFAVVLFAGTMAIWAVVGNPWEGTGRLGTLQLLLIGSLVNILGEELGWRGFLQDALRSLPPLRRYLAIGVMWEAWHFTNRLFGEPGEVAIRLAVSYPAVIVLSVAIGAAVERSRAVIVAVAIHASVNGLFEQLEAHGPERAVPAFGACLVLWLGLLRGWPVPGDHARGVLRERV